MYMYLPGQLQRGWLDLYGPYMVLCGNKGKVETPKGLAKARPETSDSPSTQRDIQKPREYYPRVSTLITNTYHCTNCH